MSEKKMHYFLFHFQKFLAATKGWKDDEVGAFLKLLIEQFDRGYVPDDPAEIDRLITSRKKNWPLLSKKFTAPSEPGQLRNSFMIEVRGDAQAVSAINSENGKKGAEAKKRKKAERLANAYANGETNAIPNGEASLQRGLSYSLDINQYPKKDNGALIVGVGIVSDMLTVFREVFPAYQADPATDYPACFAIAQKIASFKGWTDEQMTTTYRAQLLAEWKSVAEFAATDDWYARQSISMLNKKWQDLNQAKNRQSISAPAQKGDLSVAEQLKISRQKHKA